MILIDAGPSVALVNAADRRHERCREAARVIRDPIGTVWPVVTEAMYLMDFSWRAQDGLWDLTESAKLELLPLGAGESARMRELMRKYRDLPMDLVDAALVTIAERGHDLHPRPSPSTAATSKLTARPSWAILPDPVTRGPRRPA